MGPLRLRIGAPPAAQWTALHEDKIPDARAVVQGKFLDIEYTSGIDTAGLTHSVLHHNLVREDLVRHSMLGSLNNFFLQIR